jgi:hypothetical protein
MVRTAKHFLEPGHGGIPGDGDDAGGVGTVAMWGDFWQGVYFVILFVAIILTVYIFMTNFKDWK